MKPYILALIAAATAITCVLIHEHCVTRRLESNEWVRALTGWFICA